MKKIIIVCVFVLCFYNCKNKQTKDKINSSSLIEEKDSIYKGLYINVFLNDTIKVNTETKGLIKLFHPLQDSIKLSPEDMRFAIAYFNIFSNDKKTSSIKKNECDSLFYQAEILNDTIHIPFKVKPNKIGDFYIGIILDEEIFLEGYQYKDSTKSRVLLNSYNISEDIYVKE
jgi:hypothetical protein